MNQNSICLGSCKILSAVLRKREREVAAADLVCYPAATEVVLEMVVNFGGRELEAWKNFINLTIIYLHTHIKLTRYFINPCHRSYLVPGQDNE